VPKNRGKNLTLIASMSLDGMGESMCIEGATDSLAFEAYVEHFLAPSLSEGQVVVMDNLGAHRPKRIRELIEARGAELVFVPSYSPDLNPIEQAFSKIKNILRTLGVRTHEALLEAMEEALSKVTPGDVAGWFHHCGYPGRGSVLMNAAVRHTCATLLVKGGHPALVQALAGHARASGSRCTSTVTGRPRLGDQIAAYDR
jgi:transposase